MNASDTQQRVDLGQFLEDLLAVSLGNTARDDDRLQIVVLFQPGNIQNVVDRLLLGALDKRTGIDDHNIRLRLLGRDLISRLQNLMQHNLCIQLILGTTQRHKSDFHKQETSMSVRATSFIILLYSTATKKSIGRAAIGKILRFQIRIMKNIFC